MEEKKYNGLISLRLDKDLHKRVAQAAEADDRSVNNYISMVLEHQLMPKVVSKESFEQRQFVGRTISGERITPENGLVLVDGIYYRYLMDGNKNVDTSRDYVIIEANGNILVLREM